MDSTQIHWSVRNIIMSKILSLYFEILYFTVIQVFFIHCFTQKKKNPGYCPTYILADQFKIYVVQFCGASLVAQMVRNLPEIL